ncbi:ATP-binding protein [Piscinibacter sp.]|uniref:ATP-binding protein n=1 Tax=Piscinibacter sp. TaxID=1903157 RepID=UPI003416B112
MTPTICRSTPGGRHTAVTGTDQPRPSRVHRRGWVRLRGTVVADDGRRLELRFEVQDTGPGIEPERLALLFEPFEQADTSSSRRHGTRLTALAESGCDAGADSVVGQGSRFWIRVNLAHAEDASGRAAPVSLDGLRALIVDDLPEALAAEAERLALRQEVARHPSGAALSLQQSTRLADLRRGAGPEDARPGRDRDAGCAAPAAGRRHATNDSLHRLLRPGLAGPRVRCGLP